MAALWTTDEMATAMRAQKQGALPESISGLSIDTRTLKAGEAFFAIKGDARDGHEFVASALKAGAGLAVVSQSRRGEFVTDARLLVVDDVLAALTELAKASRARSPAKFIAVTGSVGKTSTKEALLLALSADGETHASTASYNNHWGVPLSLARCPQSAKYAVLEIGMNHAGEIAPLTQLVRPHVAIVTTIAPVHLEFFGTLEKIAEAKAEIFAGVEPNGAAVLNLDNAQFDQLARAAKAAGIARIVSFGENKSAEARLVTCALDENSSRVTANILGANIAYTLGAPGRHLVMNSLAVLAAVKIAGADLALASRALSQLQPATGRGTRVTLRVPGGTALLIDESYNANPASMRAALALLEQAAVKAPGRRIAVLGDMLELGPQGASLHSELGVAAAESADLVFCSGPLMHSLFEALPSAQRGGYAESAASLEGAVLGVVAAGDVVMVKGSLGSKMGPIVKALQRKFPPQAKRSSA